MLEHENATDRDAEVDSLCSELTQAIPSDELFVTEHFGYFLGPKHQAVERGLRPLVLSLDRSTGTAESGYVSTIVRMAEIRVLP